MAEELTLEYGQTVLRMEDKKMTMKPVARVTTIFLALVALAQFLRLVLRVEVIAGGVIIPLWLSALACVFTGGLAALLWRESRL